MDELSTVQRLLAEPPPGPDVIEAARLRLEHVALDAAPPRTSAAGRGGRAPGLVRRGGGPRRWPGWLAPVAAAMAVVAVVIASLAVSGAIARHNAGTGAADSSGALARVPRYFVAVPEGPGRAVEGAGRAVVGATATGAVLGTVVPPTPDTEFKAVAAAGDGRTFVLAAGVPPKAGTNALDWGPLRLYRLVLDRSGHPGRLTALPIPPETAVITGLALSHDGSELAVALLPAHGRFGPKIQVFSLATGTGREWVWPGTGSIGQISLGVSSGEMSWRADNRTLLFEETTSTPWIPQLRLLDTAAPSGSLRAASTRVPISSAELGERGGNGKNAPFQISGTPLMTADGTQLVATTFRRAAPPKALVFTITEFSVRTGKPVQVLYQLRADSDGNSPAVYWVNASGTAMIAVRTPPGQPSRVAGTVFGVQTRTGFTPLPPKTQRLFTGHRFLSRLPVW
jgi:hypothetical protein